MKLQKTDLARELLRSPRRDLPAGERMLLITVDGRRDLPQLRELARNLGLDPAVVETLYGRGLIAPVPADSTGADEVTVTQGRTGAASAASASNAASAAKASSAAGTSNAALTTAPGTGARAASHAGPLAPKAQALPDPRKGRSPEPPASATSAASRAARDPAPSPAASMSPSVSVSASASLSAGTPAARSGEPRPAAGVSPQGLAPGVGSPGAEASALAASGHEQARLALIAAQEAAGAQARRLLRAKVYALDLVARMLAGQDGDLRALARHIDNEEGLLLWIEVAAQHLRERAGDERSERFRQRVLEELGLASAMA
ncbi:hypothetical protein QRD43_06300 [Pelomonas sp. APW6]|uniref:Uncharacterized protein n=1 Tax=Roseateles subflavus TaxID=3053353 RepID=A0ABT7LIQ9_9BURK|nr:hypothetical protein [Pelomonas sp. APW6]MDL5031515.1 hypothetical protein [Pelomonas sp. APW6]